MSGSKSLESQYQKKTPLEHVLLRPDSYVGSVLAETKEMWVYDEATNRIVEKEIVFVPALYKIFDEILVNAADNFSRDRRMNRIDISLDRKNCQLSVTNNGKCIPVQLHKEHGIYIPELIFGHLLTSSNFDDSERKVTGGRNGYGAKLANIFSKAFEVEVGDHTKKKLFKMAWSNNMSKNTPAAITEYLGEDYTKVTFSPDLAKFKLKELSADMISLFQRRAYDLAGIVDRKVHVFLNGKRLPVHTFRDYVQLYKLDQESAEFVHEEVNNRWEVCVCVSESQFIQLSFVNSIHTSRGGTHVNYIVDQLAEKISEKIKQKNKDLNVKPFQVKNHLAVFINCLIENPSFDSQTKETLTTQIENYGSECILSEKFIKEVLKSNIIDFIVSQARAKERVKVGKALSGKKSEKLLGIPKLEDANWAGTKKSEECVLILTEGDSAKALAMAGMDIVGRDKFGVFPLRGKLLNVRDCPHQTLQGNSEIQAIVKILGLQFEREYSDLSSLRYGGLMIMSDQDHDGSHIKGLIINFIQFFWPSLVKINRFIKAFITPIIKVARAGETPISFFSQHDFEKWRSDTVDAHRYNVKYYKGLGTSTDKEARDYFKDLSKHIIKFKYETAQDVELIDMAFAKNKADDRKRWIESYVATDQVDFKNKILTYKDFVNKELVHFSIASLARAIPHIMDGLKPGQRKILYSCFKRNLVSEIKVAQLSGYVAEHSAYHHGEASLNQTIIGMAQDFVGSNNINLLEPLGQFGSRSGGGREAASPRYVFTKLTPLARCLFPALDDNLLNYLEDDGCKVEPEYYVPILPFVLVNGCNGIGTGWSTYIPSFNPEDIVNNLRRMMNGTPMEEMLPWFYGFNGTVQANATTGYTINGNYKFLSEEAAEITELPIGTWISDYKEFLESLMTGDKASQKIADIREMHSRSTVHFVVSFKNGYLDEIRSAFEKKMKLTSNLSKNNMVLFDEENKIHKYEDPREIIQAFYPIRLELYRKRKQYLLERLGGELKVLENKVKFIKEIISGQLVINQLKRKEVVKLLADRGYFSFVESKSELEEEEAVEEESTGTDKKNYNYLLGMKLWNLTYEKVEQMVSEHLKKEAEVKKIQATSELEMWNSDLDHFLQVYKQEVTRRNIENFGKDIVSKFTVKPVRVDTNPTLATVRVKSEKTLSSYFKPATEMKIENKKESTPKKEKAETQVVSEKKERAETIVTSMVEDKKSSEKKPKQVPSKRETSKPKVQKAKKGKARESSSEEADSFEGISSESSFEMKRPKPKVKKAEKSDSSGTKKETLIKKRKPRISESESEEEPQVKKKKSVPKSGPSKAAASKKKINLDDSDLELIEMNKAKYEVDEESRAVRRKRKIMSSDEDESYSD